MPRATLAHLRSNGSYGRNTPEGPSIFLNLMAVTLSPSSALKVRDCVNRMSYLGWIGRIDRTIQRRRSGLSFVSPLRDDRITAFV